jgi:hypothetical protein
MNSNEVNVHEISISTPIQSGQTAGENVYLGEFEDVMHRVVNAYKQGYLVVILSSDDGILHGRDDVQAIAAGGRTVQAICISGLELVA